MPIPQVLVSTGTCTSSRTSRCNTTCGMYCLFLLRANAKAVGRSSSASGHGQNKFLRAMRNIAQPPTRRESPHPNHGPHTIEPSHPPDLSWALKHAPPTQPHETSSLAREPTGCHWDNAHAFTRRSNHRPSQLVNHCAGTKCKAKPLRTSGIKPPG